MKDSSDQDFKCCVHCYFNITRKIMQVLKISV